MQHVEQAMRKANMPTPSSKNSVQEGFTSINTMMSKVLLCLVLSVAIVACSGGDTDDLRDYVKQVKATKKSHIPPLPKVKTYETYTYNDKDLRDPFIPTLQKSHAGTGGHNTVTSGLHPDFNRKRDILEQFPLDTLKMVGILERNHQRWALIKSEDGTLYRTKKGRYIGQNNGQITRIKEDSIELTEIVPDGLGHWVKRQSTLSVTQ